MSQLKPAPLINGYYYDQVKDRYFPKRKPGDFSEEKQLNLSSNALQANDTLMQVRAGPKNPKDCAEKSVLFLVMARELGPVSLTMSLRSERSITQNIVSRSAFSTILSKPTNDNTDFKDDSVNSVSRGNAEILLKHLKVHRKKRRVHRFKCKQRVL